MSKPKLINIRGIDENDDPFYRYKMEEVVFIREGSRFAFLNIVSICNSLERDPKELVKFLQSYFGTSFFIKDSKAFTTKNDLTKNILQEAVYNFIETNVLCKTCKNPETVKEIIKKQTYLKCNACSSKTPIV